MQQLFDPGQLPPTFTLVLSALVTMGSPGPSTISVTAMGAAYGFQRSLPYVAGCVLGTSAVLLAVATGLASLLVSQPGIAPWLLALSAAYILYLAFSIATAPPLVKTDRRADTPAFTSGFLMAAVNPKAYLAIAAVFAGTRLGIQSPLREALIKSLVLAGMIVLIHGAWLVAGTSFSRLFYRPRASRIINICFAVILIAATLLPILPSAH